MDSEDREVLAEYRKEMAVFCCFCSGVLAWKKPVVANWEGEYAHVSCALDTFNLECPKCGMIVGSEYEDKEEDDQFHCPECDSVMEFKSKAYMKKRIATTTLAKDDPDLYDMDGLF